MGRFLEERYEDIAHRPDPVDVAAKQVAASVGADTAAILTRRDVLEALAAAYRARAGADLDVADLFDALIAAAFDA